MPERYAVGGANSHESADAEIAGVTWRSGAMLSSTQKPRPCVEITSSFSFTSRSDTGTSGRLSDSDSHRAPSSYETYTPCWAAAYSSPLRHGSSRTVCT